MFEIGHSYAKLCQLDRTGNGKYETEKMASKVEVYMGVYNIHGTGMPPKIIKFTQVRL